MTFNTKLNIGDSIWYTSAREGCVVQATITSISLIHQRSGFYQGEFTTKVVYGSDDNHNFADYNEGKYWWSTRREIIEHLTKVLTPPHEENLDEEFEEFFREPPSKSTQNLQNAFDDVFGRKKTPPPKEKFKIVIPPDLQRGFAKLKKDAVKKEHHCGIHRISELKRAKKKQYCDKRTITSGLLRRVKPLTDIRDKTVSDLYEELFVEQ